MSPRSIEKSNVLTGENSHTLKHPKIVIKQGNLHIEKGRRVINLDKDTNNVFRNDSESGSCTKVFTDAIPLDAGREILEFNLAILLVNTLQMPFFTSVFYMSLKTVYTNAY